MLVYQRVNQAMLHLPPQQQQQLPLCTFHLWHVIDWTAGNKNGFGGFSEGSVVGEFRNESFKRPGEELPIEDQDLPRGAN